MIKLIRNAKDFLLFLPITLIFKPFGKLFSFLYHYNLLITWVRKNKKQVHYSDFYSPGRTHAKRDAYYQHLNQNLQLQNSKIAYLEFGVAGGASFNWWLGNNTNPESFFYGFDTFEGLPESWNGLYAKGDMAYQIPTVNDTRAAFFKGLFQDTLVYFLEEHKHQVKAADKRIVHLDADLYSATAFALACLYPFLKKGDIILFDEFNVATSEFKAYHEFVNNFYVELKPLAAANNFHHVAFEVV